VGLPGSGNWRLESRQNPQTGMSTLPGGHCAAMSPTNEVEAEPGGSEKTCLEIGGDRRPCAPPVLRSNTAEGGLGDGDGAAHRPHPEVVMEKLSARANADDRSARNRWSPADH